MGANRVPMNCGPVMVHGASGSRWSSWALAGLTPNVTAFDEVSRPCPPALTLYRHNSSPQF
jgi:hypothetical protein